MFSIIWFPAIISISAGYFFMSVAPLATQFMALFGVGYAGLSLFLSGLLWAHSLVQLPAGLILDKIGVYRGFLLAIFIEWEKCNVITFANSKNGKNLTFYLTSVVKIKGYNDIFIVIVLVEITHADTSLFCNGPNKDKDIIT